MNKQTILNIILAVLLSIALLVIISLSIVIGVNSNNNDDKVINETDALDRMTTQNFLIDDALNKTSSNNEDNISVFFMQRSGAYITTQAVVDILLQKQLQPDKEIYLLFGGEMLPDTGSGSWTSEVNWEVIVPEDHWININEVNSSIGITIDESNGKLMKDETFDYIFNNIITSDYPIDLYAESYTLWQWQQSSIAYDIGDTMSKINSINFFTDGTAHFELEDVYADIFSKYTNDDFIRSTELWDQLKLGEINKSDLSSSDIVMMSETLFGTNPKEFSLNVIGLTEDIYLSRENTLNSSTPGFEEAMRVMSDESKLLMKQVIGLDSYDLEYKGEQIGMTNVIISGNLVQSTPEAEEDSKKIIDVINEQEGIDNLKILYKPHPRSNDDFLTEMLGYVAEVSSVEVQIIPKEIPFEFFVMTGEFDDDIETNTDYQMYLTGTSTVVPAAYDAGIKSDNIEKYYATASELNTMHTWYDGTGIIDFNKVEVV